MAVVGGDIVIKGWPSWADIWSIVKTFVLGCLENSHANDLQNKSLLRVEVYAQPPLQHPTWQLIVNCCRCTYPLHAHFLQRLVESCPILSKTRISPRPLPSSAAPAELLELTSKGSPHTNPHRPIPCDCLLQETPVSFSVWYVEQLTCHAAVWCICMGAHSWVLFAIPVSF